MYRFMLLRYYALTICIRIGTSRTTINAFIIISFISLNAVKVIFFLIWQWIRRAAFTTHLMNVKILVIITKADSSLRICWNSTRTWLTYSNRFYMFLFTNTFWAIPLLIKSTSLNTIWSWFNKSAIACTLW